MNKLPTIQCSVCLEQQVEYDESSTDDTIDTNQSLYASWRQSQISDSSRWVDIKSAIDESVLTPTNSILYENDVRHQSFGRQFSNMQSRLSMDIASE